MKIIRDLFDQTRPIDRQIVAVINYAADAENLLMQEISEYEITDSLARHYERFMISLDAGFKGDGSHEVGVWVSGFYGSGKSSFTKYLGFALDPRRRIGSEPFLTYLQNQFPSQALRSQLGTLAKNFPATVIMIDLASVASADAASLGVSRLVYHKVLEWAGYSKDEKIALLELMIERDGLRDKFVKLLNEEGFEWKELQDDLLAANSIVSRVACKLYPKLWKDEASFSRVKVDSIYGENERLKQMLDLIERRTKNRRVLFILDEVGQFIEGTDRLILNIQGFAENLKNIGRGQAWIIATAQQTLPMAGPLFKLKDRFPDPLRIDIESTDIREITYRRLLKKSPEAVALLKKRFNEHSGAITSATQLKNTKHLQTHLDADVFARLYPFLPQHFNILMELLRSLARSTGGIGLRSTLKVIQDVLVDIKGQQAGVHLADRPVGTLATADIFFDTLRSDLERANRPLVETVAKVGTAYGQGSVHHRVAKTVAVLQFVEGFPISTHNAAAMLHASASATPEHEAVEKAVKDMLEDKELPLEIIDGSLRFMSEAVSHILTEQSTLRPSTNDQLTILNEILREQIFSPEPSARLENTKNVKAQVKLLHGTMPVAVTHSKEDLEIHLELAPAAETTTRTTDRLNDSRIPSNRNVLYLLGEDSHTIGDIITRIYRCEEIHRRHRTEAAEKEVSQFIVAQKNRADQLKRDLDTALQNAFLKGSFIFRGTNIAVSTRGTELRHACNAQLSLMAAEVFPSYKHAPQNLDTNIAEKLLLAPDLSVISSGIDPLGIVEKAGNATKVRLDHPALVAILDYLRTRGEVDGKKLIDDFNRAPYGWFKDTTRYIVSGLLISQAIRIKVGSQWLEAVGPKAIEALKNNNTFAKIDIATNDKQIPQETLNRAAKRLLDLTGDKVLPMAPKISQAVLKHFPSFRNEYASLAVELTSSSLPGADRAQSLSKQLSQILDRDASDAPVTLGAEQSTLVDNLAWAREVRASLSDGLGNDAKEASSLSNAIASLPKVGTLEKLASSTSSIRDELQECLNREDFFHAASDIRNRLTSLRQHVKAAAGELVKEIENHVASQRDSITSMEEWTGLPEEDRAEFSSRLDGLVLPKSQDIAGISQLLNRRMEIDAAITQVRSAVIERHRKWQEEQNRPPTPEPETPGEKPKPKPALKVRLRRHYTSTDQPALEKAVGELTSGLASLKAQTASEITLDLD
ncbi:BREX system P-loop protein BrxC [Prosthecobacter sp. SYSU 5D2]|uniref:BREX system P-loop protein BrxC n=1 Tax=Prosthecobacter sp. SYSU 5D2 TaxID=3134134 RepID=UPI0031FE96A1